MRTIRAFLPRVITPAAQVTPEPCEPCVCVPTGAEWFGGEQIPVTLTIGLPFAQTVGTTIPADRLVGDINPSVVPLGDVVTIFVNSDGSSVDELGELISTFEAPVFVGRVAGELCGAEPTWVYRFTPVGVIERGWITPLVRISGGEISVRQIDGLRPGTWDFTATICGQEFTVSLVILVIAGGCCGCGGCGGC